MAVQFSPAAQAKFEQYLSRYPIKRAAIMPTLWLAQEEFGWLSDEVIEYVADLLELTPAFVASVASFYTMYYRRPVGKHHVQVCTNLSCVLRGADDIVDCLRTHLRIGLGHTTEDGLFTLSEVECLGSCGTAPMMQINDDYWENLSPERTLEIVDRLARE
ncbi:MAG: NADH-quinone oxidoreductase subunit NuoE [Candidatus Binatia bacterium]